MYIYLGTLVGPKFQSEGEKWTSSISVQKSYCVPFLILSANLLKSSLVGPNGVRLTFCWKHWSVWVGPVGPILWSRIGLWRALVSSTWFKASPPCFRVCWLPAMVCFGQLPEYARALLEREGWFHPAIVPKCGSPLCWQIPSGSP